MRPLQDLPGREAAQQAAREELSRPEYDAAQPPLVLRLIGRALRALGDLLARAADVAPGGRLGQLLLIALVALAVAVVLRRVGPLSGGRRSRALFAGSPVLDAAGHRQLADQAAAEGRFADAVRERLRAVVRELEARGVLDPRPGRTAGEVARDGGAALPVVAADLRRAATVFDEVWYGGRTADAQAYRLLVDVDRAVAEARAVVA